MSSLSSRPVQPWVCLGSTSSLNMHLHLAFGSRVPGAQPMVLALAEPETEPELHQDLGSLVRVAEQDFWTAGLLGPSAGCLRIIAIPHPITTIIIAPFLIYHLFPGLALPFSAIFVSLSWCNPVALDPSCVLASPVLFVSGPSIPPVARQSQVARLHPHQFLSLSLTANRLIWPPLPHYITQTRRLLHSTAIPCSMHTSRSRRMSAGRCSLPSFAPSLRPILPLPVSCNCAIRLGS